MKKLSMIKILVVCLIITFFAGIIPQESARSSAFSRQILHVGSRGGDVYELQGRLKLLGFYNGPVDGVFGWRTYWAVRLFQYEFGIKIDGIVGPKTKLKLWQATKHWRPEYTPRADRERGGGGGGGGGGGAVGREKPVRITRGGFSQRDIQLMANAVHGEARGEPYIGQVAVAAVILNRLEHPSFPHTVAGVIFEPGAFTAVADGQIWLTPDPIAKKAVIDAINGWDPTGGAIYYFNPDTATSAWIWSRPQIKRIGKHIFCR